MRDTTTYHLPEADDTPIVIATDGGCKRTSAGPRASWGLVTDTGHRSAGAVTGPHQTAQRGEVMALAKALTLRGKKTIITDNRYLHDTVLKIEHGHTITC